MCLNTDRIAVILSAIFLQVSCIINIFYRFTLFFFLLEGNKVVTSQQFKLFIYMNQLCKNNMAQIALKIKNNLRKIQGSKFSKYDLKISFIGNLHKYPLRSYIYKSSSIIWLHERQILSCMRRGCQISTSLKKSTQWTPGSQIYLSNKKITFGQK